MDPVVAAAIKAEVRAFVTSAGTRRALPTACHVGAPGGERIDLGHETGHDQSLRTDLVERALDGLETTDGACAWLTRAGDLGLGDADASWFAAARGGFGRHGLALPAFFVLNRTGWVDLVTGEGRSWSRVRPYPGERNAP
jgi:hypothetical protein